MNSLHPSVIFFVGAALSPFLKGRTRGLFMTGVALAAFLHMLFLAPQTGWRFPFLKFDVLLLRADDLSLFMGRIFTLAGLLITLYSVHVESKEHHLFAFLYLGSALGVVFAGDLLTFFIFWEMMAVTAAVLIWTKRSKESSAAGFRYIMMHLIGGGILLLGILLHYAATNSIEFDGLAGAPFALILVGVGFKAAFIPLHTWLPDAYPKAAFVVSVLLAAVTTKAAVYALARIFPGVEAVAYMGGAMAVYGSFFALRQSDSRKLLSYLTIGSVGFMVAGVGVGTRMGIDGGLAHAWNGILYKTLLFMCVGAVIHRTGKERLADSGGTDWKMPVTALACVIAALSISGVPLFNGFASKAMIYAAARDHGGLPWLLKLGSFGTILACCKLVRFGLPGKDGAATREAPLTMLVPMSIIAFLCVLGGVYPGLLADILPYRSELRVYTPGKLIETVLLLGAAGAVFLFGRKFFAPHQGETRDFDCLYRRAAGGFLWFCRNPVSALASGMDSGFILTARGFLWFCRNPVASLASGVDALFVSGARLFVGTTGYSLPTAMAGVTRWTDELASAAAKASDRLAQRDETTPAGGDIREINSALFMVALMLALFMLYLAFAAVL